MAAIANLRQARASADRVHNCGCQLALDNFGAGLESFYYLKNLPFDYLKIDGEFTRRLSVNPADQLVVRAIVRITQGIGKKPSLSLLQMQTQSACSATAASTTCRDTISVCHDP